MTFRDKLHVMFIRDEGFRLKAYKCTRGAWTIGIGRNLSARGVGLLELAKLRTVGITDGTAYEWLDEDVRTARFDCEFLFGSPLFNSWSENRRLGWINFLFNLGLKAAKEFRNTIAYARSGDWVKVEEHLKNSKWYREDVGPRGKFPDNRGDRVIAMICREEFPYGAA